MTSIHISDFTIESYFISRATVAAGGTRSVTITRDIQNPIIAISGILDCDSSIHTGMIIRSTVAAAFIAYGSAVSQIAVLMRNDDVAPAEMGCHIIIISRK